MHWCDFNHCLCAGTQYLIISFKAADHSGDLIDQTEIVDQVLQVLVQLARAHVQFVYKETQDIF